MQGVCMRGQETVGTNVESFLHPIEDSAAADCRVQHCISLKAQFDIPRHACLLHWKTLEFKTTRPFSFPFVVFKNIFSSLASFIIAPIADRKILLPLSIKRMQYIRSQNQKISPQKNLVMLESFSACSNEIEFFVFIVGVSKGKHYYTTELAMHIIYMRVAEAIS